MAQPKTNAMRLLDSKKISYTPLSYPHEEGVAVDGATVARLVGEDPAAVLKTLVARGASGQIWVFLVPCSGELDLKKAARAAGEKRVELVAVGEILPLTGYVRGGCSPLGMKKPYPTVLDESALEQGQVLVSAGKIGWQVKLSVGDLLVLTGAKAAPVLTEG